MKFRNDFRTTNCHDGFASSMHYEAYRNQRQCSNGCCHHRFSPRSKSRSHLARRSTHHCSDLKTHEPEGSRLEGKRHGQDGVALLRVRFDGRWSYRQVCLGLDQCAQTGDLHCVVALLRKDWFLPWDTSLWRLTSKSVPASNTWSMLWFPHTWRSVASGEISESIFNPQVELDQPFLTQDRMITQVQDSSTGRSCPYITGARIRLEPGSWRSTTMRFPSGPPKQIPQVVPGTARHQVWSQQWGLCRWTFQRGERG